jgi:hypothetical protein
MVSVIRSTDMLVSSGIGWPGWFLSSQFDLFAQFLLYGLMNAATVIGETGSFILFVDEEKGGRRCARRW